MSWSLRSTVNCESRLNCGRCGGEISLSDRFCQECGQPTKLSTRSTGSQPKGETSPNVQPSHTSAGAPTADAAFDFSPPPRAADSAPPIQELPPQRLKSPLLHSEVIDFSPPPEGIDVLPRLPKAGATLVEFHNRDERERLSARVRESARGEHYATQASEVPIQHETSNIAVLTRPATRQISALVTRSASSGVTAAPRFSGGPLMDLLSASAVMLTLTAVAWYVVSTITASNARLESSLVAEASKMVAVGNYGAAVEKLEKLEKVNVELTSDQQKLLNESLFQLGQQQFNAGKLAQASSYLNRIESDSARFSDARKLALVIGRRESTDGGAEPVVKPIKRPRKTIALTRRLSDKAELSLPVLPELAEPNVEAGVSSPELENVTGQENSPSEPTVASETSTLKPAAPAPRCSEAEIAQYNRMLARWFAAKSSPKGGAAEKSDPPSFRQWLTQGKPAF